MSSKCTPRDNELKIIDLTVESIVFDVPEMTMTFPMPFTSKLNSRRQMAKKE